MKHVAIKTMASYTEQQIITSDPSQVLAIRKAKAGLKEASAETMQAVPADTRFAV